jgi:polar amino acid transport system permease protein
MTRPRTQAEPVPAHAGPDLNGKHGHRPGSAAPQVLGAPRPWSWVLTIVGCAIAAGIAYAFWSAKTIDHHTIRSYLFDPAIIDGAVKTLELTLVAMAMGIVIGVVLALLRQSDHPGLRALSGGYIWLFRGTPVLLQILLWFNISLVFPHLSLGIPFTSVELFDQPSNAVITPFVAAALGLGLNEGAYMAEIVRSGLLSVDHGEVDAARALGMSPSRVFRRITLPQSLRIIVPPTGNQLIGMLKTSALTSVIGFGELLLVSERIYGENLHVMELLTVASIWYLVMTTALTLLQRPLEKRLGRAYGERGPGAPGRLRLLGLVGR